MMLVIDAYNIIKQASPNRFINESQRQQFLQELRQYAAIKKHTMIVVFDGGPHDWPLKEHINGIEVIYSGRKESADDYIRRYINEHIKDNVLLISSDGGICSWALLCGVESIPAITFYELVLQELKQVKNHEKVYHRVQPVMKTSQEAVPGLDDLMHEVTNMAVKNEDTFSVDRKGQAKQQSKKERLVMKKIIKL